MAKKKTEPLTWEDVHKIIPFDQRTYERFRDDDATLYTFIFRMPERRIPYQFLVCIYGGSENEIHLGKQTVRMTNKGLLREKLIGRVFYVEAVIPKPQKLKSEEDLRIWFQGVLAMKEHLDNHGDEIAAYASSIRDAQKGYAAFPTDDDKFLAFLKTLPAQVISHELLVFMNGKRKEAMLTKQMERLQSQGKIIKFKGKGEDFYRAVTAELLPELN
jgi:hypothetical protein